MADRRDADFLREKWQFLRVGVPTHGGRRMILLLQRRRAGTGGR